MDTHPFRWRQRRALGELCAALLRGQTNTCTPTGSINGALRVGACVFKVHCLPPPYACSPRAGCHRPIVKADFGPPTDDTARPDHIIPVAARTTTAFNSRARPTPSQSPCWPLKRQRPSRQAPQSDSDDRRFLRGLHHDLAITARSPAWLQLARRAAPALVLPLLPT